MKHNIIINDEECSRCTLCIQDCVSSCLYLENDKVKVREKGCIACGHCEAICPFHAISLTNFEEESVDYEKQIRLDPQIYLQAIKTRRSIRQFHQKQLEQSIIDDIIEAGRFAPTAGNSQKTHMIILGSKQNELESIAVSFFQTITKPFKKLLPVIIDEHFFFKGAPLVIVLTGNKVDASLAAQNMATMAEAHGLGVLFSGFFTVCVNMHPSIKKRMQLKKEKAVTTLVIGYHNKKYYRTAKREKANVTKL